MRLGSLFDGSGGFPLAGTLCGIRPVWASEIEPYPIAVTRSRFPGMKHLGSVTDIHGGEIEPVDIIAFGSPCQDLSVAGKRAGLKHEGNGDDETTRSGLFMEAVRIIKEMREATNGVYPRFVLWENVPGAFSSNEGEDFRIVCEELIKIVELGAVMPTVPKNGWSYADHYCGDGWSLAYRVLDAQFWGVPQRRRRIFLVVDFAGQCAGEILFKRKGLRGYFKTGRTPWKGAAADAAGSVGADDPSGIVLDDQGGSQITVRMDGKSPTLRAEMHGNIPCVLEQHTGVEESIPIHDKATRFQGGGPTRNGDGAGNGLGIGKQGDPAPTLSTCDRHIVTYSIGNGQLNQISMSEQCNTLDCMHDKQAVLIDQKPRYIVRRLTPTECARLQGFPDFWGHPDRKEDFTDEEYKFWLDVRNTHAAINGKAVKDYTKQQMLTWYNKLHSNSAEYKMWGNGIALPCALYVMQGIEEVLMKRYQKER